MCRPISVLQLLWKLWNLTPSEYYSTCSSDHFVSFSDQEQLNVIIFELQSAAAQSENLQKSTCASRILSINTQYGVEMCRIRIILNRCLHLFAFVFGGRSQQWSLCRTWQGHPATSLHALPAVTSCRPHWISPDAQPAMSTSAHDISVPPTAVTCTFTCVPLVRSFCDSST